MQVLYLRSRLEQIQSPLLVLTVNVRLGLKWVTVTNPLVCYKWDVNYKGKKFYISGPSGA